MMITLMHTSMPKKHFIINKFIMDTKDAKCEEFYFKCMKRMKGHILEEIESNTPRGILFKELIRECARYVADDPEIESIMARFSGRIIDIVFRENVWCASESEAIRAELIGLPPKKDF